MTTKKSLQLLIATGFLTLAACSDGARSSAPEKPTRTQSQPASETQARCQTEVEQAVVQVAAARTTADKTQISLDLKTCETLKQASVRSPGQSSAQSSPSCATRFGESINLGDEAKSCQSLVIQAEEARAKQAWAEQQRKQAEAASQTAAGPSPSNSVPTSTASSSVPSSQAREQAKLDIRSLTDFDKLHIYNWVYIPDQNAFGHVASSQGVDNRIVVKVSRQVNGKTEHLSVDEEKLEMPANDASIQMCGQTEVLGKETLVSTKEGNIYRVNAAFTDGKILASLQVAPKGLKSYFPRRHLVDEEPVILDISQVVGLPVACNAGICEGEWVQPISNSDGKNSYRVKKLFCDGTALLASEGWMTQSEFVDKQQNYQRAVTN